MKTGPEPDTFTGHSVGVFRVRGSGVYGLFEKRVTIIVGHFGSGKTEISLNGALYLSKDNTDVTVVDLDVVKPYFRSRAARELLEKAGIGLISPGGEHHHADLPIIVPEIRNALVDKTGKLVIDCGGDGTGARVLGSLAGVIPVDDSDCLLVLNFRRPFTRNVDEAVQMINEIEAVSRMKVTGLISNTHLMNETTPEVVKDGCRLSRETGEKLGIPLVTVAVDRNTMEGLDEAEFSCGLTILDRIIRPPFENQSRHPDIGPLFVLN
jgi:hypothetical protein